MNEIGKRLKEERETYNEKHSKEQIRQKDMATFAHVDPATISRVEKGKILPSPDILIAYSKQFQVSTDYLLGLSSARTPDNSSLGMIGLSDEAIETYRFIKGISADSLDYLSILNAFLSDQQQTYNLLSSILDYLSRKYNCENNVISSADSSMTYQNEQMLDALMFTRFLQQIESVVEPRTKKSIKIHIEEKIMLLN